MSLSHQRRSDWTALLVFGVAILAVIALLGLFLTGQVPFYNQRADLFVATLVLLALLLALPLYWLSRGARILDALVARPWLLLAVGFIVMLVGALVVFGPTPLSTDEQTNLFQARLFAGFGLFAQYPAGLIDHLLPTAYQNTFILVGADSRALAAYWPGWSLLMVPFVWLGVPWLLGPLMALAGLVMIGRFAARFGGPNARGIAILLAIASGSFLLNGMSLYSAGGDMTLALIFAWYILMGGRRSLFIAGLVGSLALNLHNPVPHIAFALPWLIWLLLTPERRRQLPALIAGYLPGLALFAAWIILQGSLAGAHTGASGGLLNSLLGKLSALIGAPNPQTLGLRFWELVRAWAWSAPGLLVLAIAAWRHARAISGLWLLGLSFVSVALVYAFYPDPQGQGLGWGARYFEVAWGALPILAAVLLTSPGRDQLQRLAIGAALIGLFLAIPLELADARTLALASEAPVRALAGPGVNLTFVNSPDTAFGSVTISNDPSLRGSLVFLSEGPAADQALVDRYFPGARLVTKGPLGEGYARP
jgi:hypothetical protein